MIERTTMLQRIAVAALLALITVPMAVAEDLTAEQEAKIIAQEEKAEEQLPIDKKPPPGYTGRVVLSGEATDEVDTVVGMFVVERRAYQLRLGKKGLLTTLRAFNGKSLALAGKIRMRGKYFIVQEINIPAAGPKRVNRSRRSGM